MHEAIVRSVGAQIARITSTVSEGRVSCHRRVQDTVCGASVVRTLHSRRSCPTELNAFLRRCIKLGYRERDAPSVEEIFAMSDDQLFSKINSNSLHILQQFMPDRPSSNYSLRARPHNKTLIAKTTQLNDLRTMKETSCMVKGYRITVHDNGRFHFNRVTT